MIIWGSTGITSTMASGAFHCPGCQDKRDYRHRKLRKWFTLYFIPLFPMENIQEYVECRSCKGSYVLDVLNHDPDTDRKRFVERFEQCLRQLVCLMLTVRGTADQQQVQRGLHALDDSLSTPTSLAELRDLPRPGEEPLLEELRSLKATLSNEGKEMIVRVLFLAGATTDGMGRQEQDLLWKTAQAMDVSAAHVRGIVDTVRTQPVFTGQQPTLAM